MKTTTKNLIFTFSFLSFILSIGIFTCILLNGGGCCSEEMIQKTILVNGEERVFYVHLPPDYKKEIEKETQQKKSIKLKSINKKFPAVLIFHGTVADANKIKNYTKFNDFADKNGIVVIYPEYTGNWDWDLKPACSSKEVAFTDQLINTIIKTYKIDKKRIYQAGYSSGAEMSYILAGTLPYKIAAFAPVCGNIRKSYAETCTSKKPTSIMLVHGSDDPYEKWDGDSRKEMLSVDDTLNFWKKRNFCSYKVKETEFKHISNENNSTTAKLFQSDTCKDGTEVSILKIEGGGHTWPGSPTSARIETFLGKTNYDISGNEEIWKFFSRHRLK